MINYKNSLILSIVSILILAIIIFIALPYPFTPLSTYLEKLLIKDIDSCVCLCPWWIFILLQIFVLIIFRKYFKTKTNYSKLIYFITMITSSLLIILFHFFVHTYYVKNLILSPSVYCQYFWLISFLCFLVFTIFIPRTKKAP